ncbi:unnamed protein product [Adineta steineri]|uniref:RRM domain-containing protein n=1 Tax=Adineta steineri TaxID=433720 RepID=A0A815G4Y1_9BILA|nr:unnamed protein product [Adineta steineri]CAF1333889.1 unnamed protein product [Adineta steineri]CAF1337881.1 unnamed protein product [Adineta steineri]
MEDVQPTVAKHHQSSSSLIISSVQNCSLTQDEEDNSQIQVDRNNKSHNTTNEDSFLTTWTKSDFDKYLTELSQIFEGQSSQTDTSMEFLSMFNDIETDNEQVYSVEDLINTSDQISTAISSTSAQNEELTGTVDEYQVRSLNSLSSPSITTDTITSEMSIKNNLKKRKRDLIKNRKKTLVVTGLRADINQADLSNYFLGSVQVIMKQCQTSSFKYAFILHGTAEEAKHNFNQPIDYIRLGPECLVKYAGYSSPLPVNHQSYDKQTIAVTNIPENVSEDDLRHLFPNSRILNYCPVRTVERKTVPTGSSNKMKILWGYAFLHYNTVQQVADVIENAQQYKINDRTLCVAFYSKNNQLQSITK